MANVQELCFLYVLTRKCKKDECSEFGLDERRKKKNDVEEINAIENEYNDEDVGNRVVVDNPIANRNEENIYLNECGIAIKMFLKGNVTVDLLLVLTAPNYS